jgi:hypothetical protein
MAQATTSGGALCHARLRFLPAGAIREDPPMPPPVPVIFDSDMETDCDDAGALATVLALCDRGDARLLACICDAPTPWGPPCIQRILDYYRVASPVGSVLPRHPLSQARYADYRGHVEMMASQLYHERVARMPRPDGTVAAAPPALQDALITYRQALSQAEDGSVVIIAVGLLTALADLLDSPADAHSSLPGMELVARKVAKLVTMGGGTFPVGYDGFNWRMDRPAALRVLNHFPAPLVVNEHGTSILTGATLAATTPVENPVRLAYEAYLGGSGRSRSSWDQVTVLAAVGVHGSLLEEVGGHVLEYLPSGEHRWVAQVQGPARRHVRLLANDQVLAQTIEALMTRPLRPSA